MKRLMLAAVAVLALGTVTAHADAPGKAGPTVGPAVTVYRTRLICTNLTFRRALNARLVIYREGPNGVNMVWACKHNNTV